METIIMETLVQIATTLLLTVISVAGAWLAAKIAKRTELQNIHIATGEVVDAAQTTVLELQQTVVEGWKKAHADGKLTKEEIEQLGEMLVDKTLEKMSGSAIKLLSSAGKDISAMITGAGEALIARMKENAVQPMLIEEGIDAEALTDDQLREVLVQTGLSRTYVDGLNRDKLLEALENLADTAPQE